MVILIQGPLQPGNDINTYLELLKEELDILWKDEGVKTWDASTGNYFPMRAALLTTVPDYLGYGYIFGQAFHGHCGCVKCMDDTSFLQLSKKGSCKTVFMGHRRWLDKDDEWRSRGDVFDNTDEARGPPRKRSGEEINEMLKNWTDCPKPGKKKKKDEKMLLKVWKRKSVFWGLKYWELLSSPHSLDMMHITKNICESLLGTLFDMPEKSKDGTRARQDLKDIGIREELQAASLKRTKETAKGKNIAIADEIMKGQTVTKNKEDYCPQLGSCSTRMSFINFSIALTASKFLLVT